MRGDSQAALGTYAHGLEARARECRALVPQGRRAPAPRRILGRRILLGRLLTLKRPNKFCSMDQGMYGHLTHRNLAALVAERGDHSEAESLRQAVLAECPGDKGSAGEDRQGQELLGDNQRQAERLVEAGCQPWQHGACRPRAQTNPRHVRRVEDPPVAGRNAPARVRYQTRNGPRNAGLHGCNERTAAAAF